MTTKTIDVHETQPPWSELLPLVTAGTEIILTDGNLPVGCKNYAFVALNFTPSQKVTLTRQNHRTMATISG